MTILEAPPQQQTLTITRTIHAPVEQVYKGFTEEDWLRYWFSDDQKIRTAVGGHLLFFWNTGYHAFGTFTALEPNKKAAFTWRGMGETRDLHIEVTLDEQNGGTHLTMVTTGFTGENEYDTYKNEWETRLRNLASMLENGADLRLTERVIMGIYPADFNADIAERLGVPVTDGARVGGLVEGYGAQAAGLQVDDVVVEMNGQAIGNNQPIGAAVQGKKPGDIVDVTFYRGAEKHTLNLNLTGYPIPKIATSLAELGDMAENIANQLGQELAAVFDGVSEAEAAKRPAEGEWGANEVIAHLILSERFTHNYIGGLMQGPEVAGYTANTAARIAGVTAVYPTNAEIRAELRRAWDETIAILRHSPESLVARKSNLFWLSMQLDGFAIHTRGHFDQMRKAIEAARS